MSAPRLAEAVADRLREQIFAGDFAEGALLPKQDDLIQQFNVGLVTVREALRILEVEGLVTVKRGNLGGAVVHRPEHRRMAYMMALSLQSQQVNLADLLTTIRQLEPLSAAACAQRADRETAVLPRLQAIVEEQHRCIDDADQFIGLAAKFHVEMAAVCGIATMGLVLTALEHIWSAQMDKLVRRAARHGIFGERAVRERALQEHDRLLALIAAGDAGGAERAAREHVSETHHRPMPWAVDLDLEIGIDAALLR